MTYIAHWIEGLNEYRELMKTPKQMRLERGIDYNLTSQRKDASAKAQKRKAKQLERDARRPLRVEAIKQMAELAGKGQVASNGT